MAPVQYKHGGGLVDTQWTHMVDMWCIYSGPVVDIVVVTAAGCGSKSAHQ